MREMIFTVLDYLKSERDEAKSLTEITDETGVEMMPSREGEEADIRTQLYAAFRRNPRVQEVDGKFKYFHHLNGVNDVKEWVERNPAGVALDEFVDFFGEDWRSTGMAMVYDGSVIAMKETERNTVFLYPRGDEFFVPLSGTFSAKHGDPYVTTSRDVRQEIRRGDALKLCGKVYRVSVQPNGESSMDWLGSTKAPYSTSSVEDSQRVPKHGFCYDFTANKLPIDPPFRETASLIDGQALKFGCTNDVRAVWRKISMEPANNFTPGQFRALDAVLEGKVMSRELLDAYNTNRDERRERTEARQQAAAQASGAGTRRKRARVQGIGSARPPVDPDMS